MTRPHYRLQQLGLHLANVTAHNTANALDHLTHELAHTDGYPTHGDGTHRGTSPSSTTEAAAIGPTGDGGRLRLQRQTDDIRTAITTIEATIRHLDELVHTGLGMRTPAAEIPRCRDNQMGRAGTLEWGDPTCEELPVKAGLCSACYQRERRYRLIHSLPARDTQPAA